MADLTEPLELPTVNNDESTAQALDADIDMLIDGPVEPDWKHYFVRTEAVINTRNKGAICKRCVIAEQVPPRGFSSVWSTKHGETHLRNCANQPLIVRRHFLEAERLKKLELKLAITPGGVEGDITNPDLLEGGSVLIKRKAKDSVIGPAVRAIASPGARRGLTGPMTTTPAADTLRSATADLCDVFLPDPVDVTTESRVKIVAPIFRDYGGNLRFSGQVATVKCFENNPLVRKTLEEPGLGRVLVVDGGASMRCALLGDNIAEMAYKNDWSGIIINGCIRDSDDISRMPLGVKALNTCPLKSSKRDLGLQNVPVAFGGVNFTPGDWVYADKDGILVSPQELKL